MVGDVPRCKDSCKSLLHHVIVSVVVSCMDSFKANLTVGHTMPSMSTDEYEIRYCPTRALLCAREITLVLCRDGFCRTNLSDIKVWESLHSNDFRLFHNVCLDKSLAHQGGLFPFICERRSRKIMKQKVDVYCICRMPEWYHNYCGIKLCRVVSYLLCECAPNCPGQQ